MVNNFMDYNFMDHIGSKLIVIKNKISSFATSDRFLLAWSHITYTYYYYYIYDYIQFLVSHMH